MNNISEIHNCYGCGVCSKPCPVHIIDIRLNKEGFYEPFLIDPEKCTQCGLCRDVCAFIKEERANNLTPIASFAAWSNDDKVRKKASSGGVGMEIALYLQKQGYKIVGVRYNAEKCRAEHFIASTPEDLTQITGSKYIQSYPVEGWTGISRKEKYLITGSPCQIDSFRNYIKRMRLPEENFILLDFFCHGVPSMFVWQKYTKDIEKVTGKISYASWRNKWNYGWHDSWIMGIDGEKNGEKINWHDSYNMLIKGKKTFIQSRFSQGDKFFRLFLEDCCLGSHCYNNCKYKWAQSSADIRICDLWGNTYKENEDGVTGTVVFTNKGLDVITASNICLIEHPFDIVAEGQMRKSPNYQNWYEKVMASLRDEKQSIDDAISVIDKVKRINHLKNSLRHPLRTALKFIKKLYV